VIRCLFGILEALRGNLRVRGRDALAKLEWPAAGELAVESVSAALAAKVRTEVAWGFF
jgi:hypothetical protein